MPVLYTVVLLQSHKVSKFDSKGKLISDTEELIPHTIRDLPGPTAQMYKRTSEPGRCTITQQIPEAKRERIRGDWSRSKQTTKTASKKPSVYPNTALMNAASRGDLSAAINAGE